MNKKFVNYFEQIWKSVSLSARSIAVDWVNINCTTFCKRAKVFYFPQFIITDGTSTCHLLGLGSDEEHSEVRMPAVPISATRTDVPTSLPTLAILLAYSNLRNRDTR